MFSQAKLNQTHSKLNPSFFSKWKTELKFKKKLIPHAPSVWCVDVVCMPAGHSALHYSGFPLSLNLAASCDSICCSVVCIA